MPRVAFHLCLKVLEADVIDGFIKVRTTFEQVCLSGINVIYMATAWLKGESNFDFIILVEKKPKTRQFKAGSKCGQTCLKKKKKKTDDLWIFYNSAAIVNSFGK